MGKYMSKIKIMPKLQCLVSYTGWGGGGDDGFMDWLGSWHTQGISQRWKGKFAEKKFSNQKKKFFAKIGEKVPERNGNIWRKTFKIIFFYFGNYITAPTSITCFKLHIFNHLFVQSNILFFLSNHNYFSLTKQ